MEGAQVEPVVLSGSQAKYAAILPPEHKLYDLALDEHELVGKASKRFKANGGHSLSDAIAHEVKRAGFCGYFDSKGNRPHTVALLHDMPVAEIPLNKDANIQPEHKALIPNVNLHPTKKDELEKAKLPMPNPKGVSRPKMEFPIGTIIGHKVKVQHADNSTGWNQEGAGRILSQDPAHHSSSARNPSAR